MPKIKVKIKVSDQRGKYPAKTYEVEVEKDSPQFLWYGEPTEQFIKDNNHPPRKVAQRISVYYSRFWAEVVK